MSVTQCQMLSDSRVRQVLQKSDWPRVWYRWEGWGLRQTVKCAVKVKGTSWAPAIAAEWKYKASGNQGLLFLWHLLPKKENLYFYVKYPDFSFFYFWNSLIFKMYFINSNDVNPVLTNSKSSGHTLPTQPRSTTSRGVCSSHQASAALWVWVRSR